MTFNDFHPSLKMGTNPEKEFTFLSKGKSVTLTTIASATGRGTSVSGDSDSRPAHTFDFESGKENFRLVVFYCSGTDSSAEAKLFAGNKKAGSHDFTSTSSETGLCSAKNLQKTFTDNCAALK